jgi:protein-disulfide isomerase
MENTINNIQPETKNANSTDQVVVVKKTNYTNFITPAAIVIAGIAIAFSLYTRGDVKKTPTNGKDLVNSAINQPAKTDIADISSTDHIRGSKDAKIVLIEYSDTECPFCKMYQVTMKKIFDEYSKNNQVAWVYRHFPISYGDTPLHSKSKKESEAMECAAELGGEDMFWKYTDQVYATTGSNNTLDPAQLPEIAVSLGLDRAKFTTCLDSGKYAQKIRDSYDASLKAGAQGTPYTVIKYKGEFIPMVNDQGQGFGAVSYDVMKQIIDNLLAQK